MDDHQNAAGILIRTKSKKDFDKARAAFLAHGLHDAVQVTEAPEGISLRISEQIRQQWAPDGDTLRLCEKFHLDTETKTADLEQEILLAMLLGPVVFEYPSYEEFAASVRIRRNIVEAARKTVLAFHTSKIERPEDCWTYTEESGFTILQGKSLIEALRKATQPEVLGELYSFSCYRATEYVILLGIAQELAASNPLLLEQLQHQWESRAIKSGEFHEVFLREYGSMSEPLPPKYYVPGDRLWFRNPDERSSDVTGYEGSWVFYLGGGLFTNFWNRNKPYTLASKCVEIYHWRDGVYLDAENTPQMDEAVVEERVRVSMESPVEIKRIVEQMMRLREPQGIYVDGGCIDTSREYPRWVCSGSTDIVLPGEPYMLCA